MSTTQWGLSRAKGVKEKLPWLWLDPRTRAWNSTNPWELASESGQFLSTGSNQFLGFLGMKSRQSLGLPQNHATKSHQSQTTLEKLPKSPCPLRQETLYKLSTMFSLLLLLTLEAVMLLEVSFPIHFLKEVCCAVWQLVDFLLPSGQDVASTTTSAYMLPCSPSWC